MLTENMIAELIRGLTKILEGNVLQIILYGSVARKEENQDSDIDIAIILEHKLDVEVQKQFIALVADLDIKFDRIFSVVDIEKDNIEKWGNVLPFYKNIKEEGILLWKAA